MASSPRDVDGDLGFQIAPMVDVVFVLVLFFMVVCLKPPTRELTINIPGQGSTVATIITIDIQPNGQVYANNREFDLPADKQLRQWLSSLYAVGENKDPVVIHPSNDTPHERVIDVMLACSASKVKNVTFK